MMFDTLYKKSSTGADQQWLIRTEGNTIITSWGQIGGAQQETRDVVKEGKNLGKKNETSAETQAQLEAEATWTKKLKKGYVKSLKAAQAGKVDKIIEGGVNPMLAHRFDEQGHKIVFPALAQPKFDGHRCIAIIDEEGAATLWTRTRKPITGLPHLIRDIEAQAKMARLADFVLDGELYNHDYRARFEELSSFIRSPEPVEGNEVVQYHIYDIADENYDQEKRQAVLAGFFSRTPATTALVRVETIEVETEDDTMEAFAVFRKKGYEGLMLRNKKGLYVGKRSYDLQKVKEFEDQEFEVVGVEEGRGKLAGHAIFVCVTNGDKRMAKDARFNAKMKGETSALKQYFDKPALAIGRQLTVSFQGITNKEKVPRFPVGLRFRED